MSYVVAMVSHFTYSEGPNIEMMIGCHSDSTFGKKYKILQDHTPDIILRYNIPKLIHLGTRV